MLTEASRSNTRKYLLKSRTIQAELTQEDKLPHRLRWTVWLLCMKPHQDFCLMMEEKKMLSGHFYCENKQLEVSWEQTVPCRLKQSVFVKLLFIIWFGAFRARPTRTHRFISWRLTHTTTGTTLTLKSISLCPGQKDVSLNTLRTPQRQQNLATRTHFELVT